MHSRDPQCHRLLSARDILPLCGFDRVSPDHPRAFFIVQSEPSKRVWRRMHSKRMSGSAPPPAEPRTPRTPRKSTGKEQSYHSTPSQKQTLSKIQEYGNGEINSESHGKFIKHEYSKVDFISAVFRFSWKDIHPTPYVERRTAKHNGGYYCLDGADVKKYRTVAERKGYPPLERLTNGLLRQLYGPERRASRNTRQSKPTHDATSSRRQQVRDHRTHEAGVDRPTRDYRGRLIIRDCEAKSKFHLKDKPDCTYGVTAGKNPAWEWEGFPVEVGRTEQPPKMSLQDILISRQNVIFSIMSAPNATKTPVDEMESQGEATVGDEPLQAAMRVEDDLLEGSSSAKDCSAISEATTSKRKRTVVEESSPSGSKRSRVEAEPCSSRGRAVTNKEAQIMKYVDQIVSHNVRSYAVGWLIEDARLRLVYGDRMGLVFTKPIDFLGQDAALFLLIVAATGAAGVHDLGIHPNVHFPRDDDGYEVFALDSEYTGATLHLPTEDNEDLQFDFDVQPPRKLYTEFGLIGRGTAVIPVKAKNKNAREMCGEEELVAKVAWPHAARKAENEMIDTIREGLRSAKKDSYLRHVVDMKYSATKTIEEMGLPRCAMNIVPDGPDLRVCRTLILKAYRRLDDIGSAARFHSVFVDVVRAHHWVYETSNILHRDISTNNIMWYEGQNGQPVGVLCDWDLAESRSKGDIEAVQSEFHKPARDQLGSRKSAKGSTVLPMGLSNSRLAGQATSQATGQITKLDRIASQDEQNETPMTKPRYRTGTGPFMAVDLLRVGPPPLHKYRHDLESFFYVYVTAAAAYDPPEQRFRKVPHWEQQSLVVIGDSKHNFLMNMEVRDQVFENVHLEFEPLLAEDSFLIALWAVFMKIESLHDQIASNEITRDHHARLGTPMDELDTDNMEIEKKRDSLMTYSKFMQILREPEDK
ncbi:hypothetical protein DAEQUDRAFT_729769 [Daedalea quercina L-15889]|uniref:Fungal-type protein kinase domain-containing protein n=1 Tax=Daedalea quercina L-15889 TaxID=1314783 RepID=A0A165NCH7_9APHY|nr:hypothetical protein DAEQUDRAFT_729769 [Daedalea quercina L-15889]